MTIRVASCSCGQLKVACQGEPQKVSLCHCLECQRRTGSTYGIAAFFLRSQTSVQGRASTYERLSDSGFSVAFHFCPQCGSTVFWEPSRKPDAIGGRCGRVWRSRLSRPNAIGLDRAPPPVGGDPELTVQD